MNRRAPEQLADLARRIERMAIDPGAIDVPWRMKLARPVYRLIGWRPKMATNCVAELLAALGHAPADPNASAATLARALAELEDNVRVAERACMLNGRVATAELAWLGRMGRVLGQALRMIAGEAEQALATAAAFDPVVIAAPLAVAAAVDPSRGPENSETRGTPPDPGQTRLLELQLAAIDHVIEAARAESSFLERKRRLLEAARRLLLDADATLALEAEGVRLRKRYLAEQIVHVDRLQATGLSSKVGLLHQARAAASRGQRGRLYASLVALEGFATAAGDLRAARLSQRALERLTGGADTTGDAAHQQSLRASAREVMGGEVLDAVASAYAAARKELRPGRGHDPEMLELALDYLAPGAEDAALSALLSVDGCFDVGAPLAPVRVEESRTVARVVPFPTADLMLMRARGPEDLAGAVIEDPRSLLLDLAAGRLLTRKFIRYEEVKTARVEMMGEVRVYLLDGSTSMLEDGSKGARARMRDAILTAELATLLRRFRNPQRYTRVVLYYRYFTKRMGPLVRVATPDEAIAAMGDVLGQQRQGGTDIEKALAVCFEMIREARAADPVLARGQVVLITDGNARVHDEVVREAREGLGSMPVAVSVVALGEQNDALRRLVARQRAQGERAFYHFIDDATLGDLCDGRLGGGRALHLGSPARVSKDELERAVASVLDEAAELERDRHRVLYHPPADLAAAYAELGLPASLGEGPRALAEAAERDRRAVETRYARWFPLEPELDPGAAYGDDRDAVVVLLSTVAEVVGELEGDALSRKADAIDVLERLLPDARLSPARYDELLRTPDQAIREALFAVHEVTFDGPSNAPFGH